MSDKQPLMQPQQQGNSGYPPSYPSSYPPSYPTAPAHPPPAYGYAPAPVQQHNTTVVVNNSQPRATVVYHRRYGAGDHYLALSIIMSFVCFFFGTWWALVCTIPAVFLAISAQEAEARGDTITMEKNRRTALYLNIGAVITGVVTWILLVIIIIVRVAALSASGY